MFPSKFEEDLVVIPDMPFVSYQKTWDYLRIKFRDTKMDNRFKVTKGIQKWITEIGANDQVLYQMKSKPKFF